MSLYENIFGFITDRSKRLSTRATAIILTVFTLALVDNIIGFSYYFNKQRQLDQLKSISILLNNSVLSKETKNELIELEKQTFKRKNIIDHSISFINNISWTNKTSTKYKNNISTERNNIWFLFSVSGLYILTTLAVIPVVFITDKKTPFFKLLASMIMFVIVMFFSSWFNYWLFDKIIPDKIFGSWTWNYIINFAIQIGLVIGLVFATNTMNKTSTSE